MYFGNPVHLLNHYNNVAWCAQIIELVLTSTERMLATRAGG
jgi:hypothetical protein